MTTPIAIPVVAICLMVTTPEVVAGKRSRVATQELAACTICNTREPPCEMPPEFEALARRLNGQTKGRPHR